MHSRTWKEIFLIDLRVVEHAGDSPPRVYPAGIPGGIYPAGTVLSTYDVPIGWIVDEGKGVRFLTPRDFRMTDGRYVHDAANEELPPGSVAIEGIYGAAKSGFSCLGDEKAEHVNNLNDESLCVLYHWAHRRQPEEGRFKSQTLACYAEVTGTYKDDVLDCVGIDLLGPLVIEEATWVQR